MHKLVECVMRMKIKYYTDCASMQGRLLTELDLIQIVLKWVWLVGSDELHNCRVDWFSHF